MSEEIGKNGDLPEYHADMFEALEELEKVQRRPSMYLGGSDYTGIRQLLVEVIDNSVDESNALNGYRLVNIKVILHNDGSVTVSDNGRGIPIEVNKKTNKRAVHIAFEVLHGGAKISGNENTSYENVIGANGIGVSAVNAVSEYVDITIKRDGTIYRVRYENAVRVIDLKELGKCNPNDTGTTINFRYSPKFLKAVDNNGPMRYPYNIEDVLNTITNYVIFNPNVEFDVEWDTRMEEKGEDGESLTYGEEGHEVFSKDKYNPRSLIEQYSEGSKVVELNKKLPNVKSSVNLLASFTDGYTNKILKMSAVNGLPVKYGTHMNAFEDEIYNFVERTLSTKGVLEDSLKLDRFDVLNRVNFLMLIYTEDKSYAEQIKANFSSKEVASALRTEFVSFLANIDPEVLATLLDSVEIEYKNRIKTKKDVKQRKMGKISKEKKAEFASSFQDVSDDGKRGIDKEVWFVEGDSAATAFKYRDLTKTAVQAFKGKPLNVNKRDEAEVYEDEIFQRIQYIVEMNKYKYYFICTDADVDGEHIRSLIILIFLEYFPQIIEEDRLLIAHAPLFRLENKKGERVYVETEAETKEPVEQGWKTTRFKGLGEMEDGELYNVLEDSARYSIVTKDHFQEKVIGDVTREDAVKLLTGKNSGFRKIVASDCITERLSEYMSSKVSIKSQLVSKVNPLFMDTDGVPLTQDDVDELYSA